MNQISFKYQSQSYDFNMYKKISMERKIQKHPISKEKNVISNM
jgi:hypothetical protein